VIDTRGSAGKYSLKTTKTVDLNRLA